MIKIRPDKFTRLKYTGFCYRNSFATLQFTNWYLGKDPSKISDFHGFRISRENI